MAGFPYHQLESYLGKLIAAGLRAAICDQVEDPAQAKGLVKRELTRIVTPGTVTDDALLDPRESNYLAAIVPGEAVRPGLGRSFDRPISGGAAAAGSTWPTSWPASRRSNACVADDAAPLPRAAGDGCRHAAARPGPFSPGGRASRWPQAFRHASRWKGSASTDERRARRSARPARARISGRNAKNFARRISIG